MITQSYGITPLLTFNAADFRRLPFQSWTRPRCRRHAGGCFIAATEQIGGEEVPLRFGQWHKLEDQLQKVIPANLKRLKCRYERDKPMWARRIIRQVKTLDGSDLRQRVQELVNAIVRAQGFG